MPPTAPDTRWNPRELREEVNRIPTDLNAIMDGNVEEVGPRYDLGRLLAKHDPFRRGGIHSA